MAHVATVTIQASQVPEDQTDFVVLVVLDSDAAWDTFWSTVKADGGDIRCFKSDGTTELAREVGSIDTGAKTGELWIKFSGLLSSSSDTEIQIHADGVSNEPAVTDTYGRNAVWSGVYESVWHLQEDGTGGSGSIIDSTGRHHGTPNGPTNTGGWLGQTSGALSFDGSNDRVEVGDVFSLGPGSEISVSGWLHRASGAVGEFWVSKSVNADYEASFYIAGSRVPSVFYADSSSVNGSPLEWRSWDWTYAATVIDSGGNVDFRLDDTTESASGTVSLVDQNAALWIGGRGPLANFMWDGRLDEIRIRLGVPPTGWHATEYNNQSAPATFYTVTEAGGGATVPIFRHHYEQLRTR